MSLASDVRILEVLGIVLALIFLDYIIGVVKSIGDHTFNLQKFPAQLANFVLPYFTPLAVLGVSVIAAPLLNLTGVTGATAVAFYASAATVALKALDDIMSKVGVSFGTSPSVTPVVVPPAPKP